MSFSVYSMKEKLALFCNVRKTSVIQNSTADNLYAVPLLLEEEGLAREVCKHLRLENVEPNNGKWEEMIQNMNCSADRELVTMLFEIGENLNINMDYYKQQFNKALVRGK